MADYQSTEGALAELQTMSLSFAGQSFTISQIIATAGLAITLIFVIYQVSSNKPRAREYVIAWFIGLILYILFMNN